MERRSEPIHEYMARIEAVIFDLDDTLYPERQYALGGFAAVARAFADELGPVEETIARMVELLDREDRSRIFDELLSRYGLGDHDRLLSRMIETYRLHKPVLSFHPDAEAALTRFRGRFRLGLISDGRLSGQQAKVQALHLESRVDEIILTDQLGQGFAKPHPRAFELMAERLAMQPNQCVYVADNASKDFVAPNRLGWTSVQILRTDGFYEHLKPPPGGEPKYVIRSLDELDRLPVFHRV